MASAPSFPTLLEYLRAAHESEVAALIAEIARLQTSAQAGEPYAQTAAAAKTTRIASKACDSAGSDGCASEACLDSGSPSATVTASRYGLASSSPASEFKPDLGEFKSGSTKESKGIGPEDTWHGVKQAIQAPSEHLDILLGADGIKRRPRTRLARLVLDPTFELVFACIIVLNVASIAAEAQYKGVIAGESEGFASARLNREWPNAEIFFGISHWVFGIVFCAEVVVKLVALRLHFLVKIFNLFDIAIVGFWLANVLGVQAGSQAGLIRMLRLVKLLRLVHLVRTMQSFDALFVITTALKYSIHTLAWSFLTLVAALSLFALAYHQVLMEAYLQNTDYPWAKREEVYMFFGTFTRSLFSMFELTFGNWVPIARILGENVTQWFMCVAVLLKMTLGFAVVGVINGVFIQETFKAAALDDDIMMRQKAREQHSHLTKMRRLFKATDTHHDNKIWPDELRELLSDPEAGKWVSAQGLSCTDDASLLFSLLDKDKSGYITKKELLKGFSDIKGQARSVDLKWLMKEVKAIHKLVANQQAAFDLSTGYPTMLGDIAARGPAEPAEPQPLAAPCSITEEAFEV